MDNATSLKIITKKEYDPVLWARKIHKIILGKLMQITVRNMELYLESLNNYLYKKIHVQTP